ncbi:MAG: histidinol-phosphate transaminase [Phycisphaerae bacterium]|nr:histidinol-phosphate transaminase [Phycisphaerae bacterium]
MSYFRDNIDKMDGYVPGFQPSAVDVVKLNTNENPYPPSPKVLEAISKITTERLRRYPDPLGNAFRQAAAEVHGLSPENILCTNGGDDLLTMVFRAFCDENRPAAYPVPTYTLYPVLAKIQNCPVIEVPFDSEFNLPAKLASAGVALTIVCNPNAPTATVINKNELASLADELKGILLIDEAYVDFAEDNCLSLVKDFDNIIILRSMSKGYSLAGVRFGYAVANPTLIDGLIKVKDSYNVDSLAIIAATEAIKDQQWFKRNVEKVKSERQRLTDSLRDLGFPVLESSTNFLLAPTGDYKANEIYDKLSKQNIFVRYFNVPGLDDRLRITVGTPPQNDQLIAALKKILER